MPGVAVGIGPGRAVGRGHPQRWQRSWRSVARTVVGHAAPRTCTLHRASPPSPPLHREHTGATEGRGNRTAPFVPRLTSVACGFSAGVRTQLSRDAGPRLESWLDLKCRKAAYRKTSARSAAHATTPMAAMMVNPERRMLSMNPFPP